MRSALGVPVANAMLPQVPYIPTVNIDQNVNVYGNLTGLSDKRVGIIGIGGDDPASSLL